MSHLSLVSCSEALFMERTVDVKHQMQLIDEVF